MSEAFLTVAEPPQRQTFFVWLHKELLRKITSGKSPEVLLVLEGVGYAQQTFLVAAVLRKRKHRNAANIGDISAAQEIIEYLILAAENTARPDIYADSTGINTVDMCFMVFLSEGFPPARYVFVKYYPFSFTDRFCLLFYYIRKILVCHSPKWLID